MPNLTNAQPPVSDTSANQLQAETPGLVVTTASDVVDPFDGKTSLREALAYADSHAGADTITFAASLAGQTITLTQGELVIASDVAIDGDILGNDDKADITISGNHVSRVFNVTAGTATLDSLNITGGEGGSGDGGAVHAEGGTNLTIEHSSESDSHAGAGGGIESDGTLGLTGSTLTGNSAI